MKELIVDTLNPQEVLKQLQIYLNGNLEEQWGENILDFNNEFGSGKIRCIEFDWGVSLMDYNVHFKEDIKIVFISKMTKPIEFIFVTEGNIKYISEENNTEFTLERFQNIIISNHKKSKETYLFPGKIDVKVNFINVLPSEYAKKKNNNLSFLNDKLRSAFQGAKDESLYNHFGNFNLKIADQIKQLQETSGNGIVKTLSIEGQLNLIMAMQMLEQDNFEKGNKLPDTLPKDDIKKIHELATFIVDNISETLTVVSLSERSGLSPKKLQLGFRVLYSKSVNEYIRQMKLEISRDLILNTDDTISEIVYNIGFKSRSYFSKIFYEKYGILPTEYRKKSIRQGD